MGQKKLIRFEAIKSFQNVFQYPVGMAGNWKEFFKNEAPITLELACGRGEYTVALAKLHPTRNFIGIDLKGNRLYIGASKCIKESISNAAFLRTQIDKIDSYFNPGEIDEIWITYPDPQLRNSKARKRLTHPKFLRLYQLFLKPGGSIHLKTDSPELYEFTKLVIEMHGLSLHEDLDHVYAHEHNRSELYIKTHYESLDIAGYNRVHYLHFSLPSSRLPDLDDQLQERINGHEKITG